MSRRDGIVNASSESSTDFVVNKTDNSMHFKRKKGGAGKHTFYFQHFVGNECDAGWRSNPGCEEMAWYPGFCTVTGMEKAGSFFPELQGLSV